MISPQYLNKQLLAVDYPSPALLIGAMEPI
jgi:hypothetical protein